MKKIFSSILALAVAAVSFTSCEDVPAPYDINGASGNGSSSGGSIVITPSGSGTQADPFNVAAIQSVASGLAQGEESTVDYYFTGIVSSIKEINNTNYGNATFYISDNGETNGQFYIYHAYGFNNQKITDANIVQIGDTVTICGKITNYNGTLETAGNKAYIYSVKSKSGNTSGSGSGNDNPPTGLVEPLGDGTFANPFNVAGAIKYINNNLAADATSTDEYYVKGKVLANNTTDATISTYGNMTFTMVDEGDNSTIFTAFQVYGPNKEKFTSVDQIKPGQEVVVCGKLTNYKGNTPETVGKGASYVVSINGEGNPTGGNTGDGGGTGDGGNTGDGTSVVLNADASTVTMTATGVSAGTETVTIDFNELCTALGIASSSQVTTLESNGITFTFDKGTGSNTPIYHSGTMGIRVYGGNTITIVGAKTIASIVAECDTYNGTFYGGQASATAEFNGSTVVYSNVGSGTTQFRVKKITITYAK